MRPSIFDVSLLKQLLVPAHEWLICSISIHGFGRMKNLTAGIIGVFRGLNFESNTDIKQISHLWTETAIFYYVML